ncbi:hypothetical protein amrb99_62160 [Actinomadura sp. RB99]|uniref:hypothetical protein n=1 Tax=Actinomadura sp. RB99 TaxID=2691577 RepID=UPI001682EB32|nr:hypothetical protein [Actinomadura sp. RB99]MBD2897257.1 hypothetical protein [Actinomadura sp. RB99]
MRPDAPHTDAIDRRIDELLGNLPPLTDDDRHEAAAILAAAPPRRAAVPTADAA